MAILYISEYANIGGSSGTAAQVAQEPALVQQTVAISGTSTVSAPFNANTRYVRLHTDTICSVDFGIPVSNPPVATLTTERLAANQTEYFGVPPGGQLAVILNT